MHSADTQAGGGPEVPGRRMSIHRRVILLIVVVSIPLVLERLYALHQERQVALAATVQQLQHVANDVSLAQRETVGVATAVTQTLARQATTLLQDPAACDAFLRRVAADITGLRSLLIADSARIVRCASTRELLGYDLSRSTNVQHAIDSFGPALSNFIVSSRTGRSLVSVADAQRKPNGEVAAVAIAAVDLEWLSEVLARTDMTPGITAMILDGKGIVLARYPARSGTLGTPYEHAQLLTLQDNEDRGTFVDTAAEGGPRLYAFARVPGTGVRVLASMREADATGAIDRRMLTTLATFLMVIAIFICLALYLAQRMIFAPVARLAEDLLDYGRGDSQNVRGTDIKEFEPVVGAYTEMSRRLTAQTSNLRSLNHRLAALASTDGLTGLVNRRSFDVTFSEEWVRCADAGLPLSLIMADVDHFKQFNDSKGHLAGDEALRGVARMLSAAVAGTPHLAARYGGEEFIILMADTDLHTAMDFAESARELVLALGIAHARSPLGHLTASFGVASMQPSLSVSPDALLARVDTALYDAKRLGRNRVVCARDAVMPVAS